jgi:hypothetical protein
MTQMLSEVKPVEMIDFMRNLRNTRQVYDGWLTVRSLKAIIFSK